jgi:ApaG protein
MTKSTAKKIFKKRTMMWVVYIAVVLLLSLATTSSYKLQKVVDSSTRTLLKRFMATDNDKYTQLADRKELWKVISKLEKQAIDLLSVGDDDSTENAYKLLAQSIGLKNNDPFFRLANSYSTALNNSNVEECSKILVDMKQHGVPPHISSLISQKKSTLLTTIPVDTIIDGVVEEVDPGSTFSDTVTEKIRVKVNSFFDKDKSDPINGKYMFWYKVGIYNEGPEPVQIVARMWEIEKCIGEKEVVRGAGIMSTQPIIPPGDVFTYQSVCPLKVFPPKGKRVLGSMSGAYTMCKGNMGQHNFTVKVGKFNLILPEN